MLEMLKQLDAQIADPKTPTPMKALLQKAREQTIREEMAVLRKMLPQKPKQPKAK